MKNEVPSTCTQCEKNLQDDGFYKVDRVEHRYFCSEECILDFYGPMILYFEEEEQLFRRDFRLPEQESFFDRQEDYEYYLGEVIDHPDEIYVDGENFSEEIVFVIKKFHVRERIFWGLCIGIYHEKVMSFIVLGLFTANKDLMMRYRRGKSLPKSEWKEREFKTEKCEVEENKGDLLLDDRTQQLIERKRDQLWKELQKKRSHNDLDLEDFSIYEPFLEETMASPDEIHSFHEEKFLYKIFSKAVRIGSYAESVFFVVICLCLPEKDNSDSEIFIPLIFFPTRNRHLIHFFKRGERIHGPIYS